MALVRESMSLHQDVAIKGKSDVVKVLVNGKPFLEVHKKSEDEAEITRLDLRMIGINIFGDTNGLHVGPQVFSRNYLKNVDCMAE